MGRQGRIRRQLGRLVDAVAGWGHRRGRRGGLLVFLGVVYIAVGAQLPIFPPVRVTEHVFHLLMPMPLRVAFWFAAGAVAIIWAHRRDDTIGWRALYLPPALRVLSYLGSVVVWVFTGGNEGTLLALLLALTNGGSFVGVVLICSGWTERRAQGGV